jgi:hypothetical protein
MAPIHHVAARQRGGDVADNGEGPAADDAGDRRQGRDQHDANRVHEQ